MKKDKPYVSDVLDYTRDILPNKVNLILAGVGSGKNYFAESLATFDETLGRNRCVLIITSRRLKVDQTISYYDDTEQSVNKFIGKLYAGSNIWLEKEDYINSIKGNSGKYSDYMRTTLEFGKTFNTSVVCTNALIVTVLKRLYSKYRCEDNKYLELITMFWKLFDVIVIDECHSMIADALYQDAPFHIRCLVKAFYKADTRCRMILQTGTPTEILLNDLKSIAPDLKEFNLLNVCRNVKPKEIWIINHRQIKDYINYFINVECKRVIYFSNVIIIPHKFLNKSNIQIESNQVAAIFSDEDRLHELTEEELNNKTITEESIKLNGKLPDNIELLLATAKLKEGVDIYDEDIGYVIVETKNLSDIVQYCGRVRSGNFILCYVVDAWQYMDKQDFISYRGVIKDELIAMEYYNTDLDLFCDDRVYSQEDIQSFITKPYENDKYKAFQYNYFTCRFEEYRGKILALDQQEYFQELFDYEKDKKKTIENRNRLRQGYKTIMTLYNDENIKLRTKYNILKYYFDKMEFKIICRSKRVKIPTYKYDTIRNFFVSHNFIIGSRRKLKNLNSYLHSIYSDIDLVKLKPKDPECDDYYFLKKATRAKRV